MDNKTSYNINSLRWYLCLTVFFTHFYKMYFSDYHNPFISWVGFLSVCFFLIISGYVNYNSIKKNNNIYLFILSRFKRILPLYYLSLIFSFFVIYLFDIEINNEWFLNFIFFQSLFGFDTIPSNEPLWSLPYEVFIYLIFSLCYKFYIFYFIFLILLSIYSFFVSSYIPILFLILFYIGSFFSYKNYNLSKIHIPFFYQKNLTYEFYIFHYPILLILFYKIFPLFN